MTPPPVRAARTSLATILVVLAGLSQPACIATFRQDSPGAPALEAATMAPRELRLLVRIDQENDDLTTTRWEEGVTDAYRSSGLFSVSRNLTTLDEVWIAEVEILVRGENPTTALLTLATAFLVPSRQRTRISMLTRIVEPGGVQRPIIREEASLDTWLGWIFLPVALASFETEDDVASAVLRDLTNRSIARLQARGDLGRRVDASQSGR